MRAALGILATGLTLASCQGQQRERAEALLIAEAQAAVTEKMLDPNPVFRDVSVEEGGVSVCGTVNGMNRLGGYSGSRRFVWVKGGVAIIEDPNPRYRMREGVRDPAACMFNAQFDECKGMPSSDSTSTCLAGL
jgi:hypothetical protein